MPTVGYSNRTRYWQQYVFANPPAGYKYTRGIDIPFNLLKVNRPWVRQTKFFFPLKSIDIYHVYNGIVLNKKPWVVEVETTIPRYGKMSRDAIIYRMAVERLRSTDCKQIIFISECTKQLNQRHMANLGIDPEKCQVLYRAVELHTPLQRHDDLFRILFVGNGFFRKGGVEVLKAFESITRQDVRLTIVSSFEVDWAVFPSTEDKTFVETVTQRDDRITVLSNVAHADVIGLMRKSDVYISPTFADTFNNTIMEAMGCQLPIITTDVRSIPEFVQDGRNGFLIPLNAVTKADMPEMIAHHLLTLIDNRQLRSRMGLSSSAIAAEMFSIERRNRKLKDIYDAALT